MANRVLIYPDDATLAYGAGARLLVRLHDLTSTQEETHLVLTGGTVGIELLRQVATNPLVTAVDWTSVHLWWGDERFLPDGDADRNETQARDALLDQLVSAGLLPAANIHQMPALSDAVPTPERSAELYRAELAKFSGLPAFDLVLFGMGPDGHIASLFPDHPGLEAEGDVVPVHDSPKPPPLRVSLSATAVPQAKEIWVVASGAGKAPAVARALSGTSSISETPATLANQSAQTVWLLDAAAAAPAEQN